MNRYLFIFAIILLLTAVITCVPAGEPSTTDNISNDVTANQTGITEPPPVTENTTDNQTGSVEPRPGPEDLMPRISIEELKQKMDSGANILIVDTRTLEEFNVDHIKGAVSAPLDDIISGKWQPAANRELILYCA